MIPAIASKIPQFIPKSPAARLLYAAGALNGAIEGVDLVTDTVFFKKDYKGREYRFPTIIRGSVLITGAGIGAGLGGLTAPVSVPLSVYDVYLKYGPSQQKKSPD